MEKEKRYSTGIQDLDKIIEGGLFLGENVVWEAESGTFAREFMNAFIKQGIEEGHSVIYLDFIYPPQAIIFHFQPLIKQLPKGWEDKFLVLDCFTDAGGQGELVFSDFYDQAPSWIRKVPSSKDPDRFHHFFGRIEREFVTPGTRLVFYSLSMMEQIWGQEAVKTFFSHVCPALYAYETLAYWLLIKHAHPVDFITKIEHTTQIAIDLSKEQDRTYLTVRKGGQRYSPSVYKKREYSAKGSEITFKK
ncbi:MAG: elongator complex protein 4 [Candidatus Bathyarchaeota archaeon]|nr:elongator complex protein 4 [Candidatus Bathyarchaeota archaeon]